MFIGVKRLHYSVPEKTKEFHEQTLTGTWTPDYYYAKEFVFDEEYGPIYFDLFYSYPFRPSKPGYYTMVRRSDDLEQYKITYNGREGYAINKKSILEDHYTIEYYPCDHAKGWCKIVYSYDPLDIPGTKPDYDNLIEVVFDYNPNKYPIGGVLGERYYQRLQ